MYLSTKEKESWPSLVFRPTIVWKGRDAQGNCSEHRYTASTKF